jgi:hypothetical protein
VLTWHRSFRNDRQPARFATFVAREQPGLTQFSRASLNSAASSCRRRSGQPVIVMVLIQVLMDSD